MGVWTQLFPPSPHFTEAQTPSLAGKVFIVTGGNSGVGFELAKILYSKGGNVYVAGRSATKITTAIEQIKAEAATTGVSDKLPALSGLAHEFHDRTGYTYTAGLWQESMQRDLLWIVETFTEVVQKPETYVAPSWSWASHHGPVNFFSGSEGLIIRTPRAETFLASADPFGQVTGGYLRIAGKTQRVLVRYNETSKILALTYTSCDQSLYSTSTGQEIGRCSFDERSYLVKPGSGPEGGVETEVTCLPIQYRNTAQYIVMILQPTDSGKD